MANSICLIDQSGQRFIYVIILCLDVYYVLKQNSATEHLLFVK